MTGTARKTFGIATLLAGAAAAAAIAWAPWALATDTSSAGGTVALPPGGPVAVYPQEQLTGGADPYVPFGTDPFVPYGVWSQQG
jgi:hypothetical protein